MNKAPNTTESTAEVGQQIGEALPHFSDEVLRRCAAEVGHEKRGNWITGIIRDAMKASGLQIGASLHNARALIQYFQNAGQITEKPLPGSVGVLQRGASNQHWYFVVESVFQQAGALRMAVYVCQSFRDDEDTQMVLIELPVNNWNDTWHTIAFITLDTPLPE